MENAVTGRVLVTGATGRMGPWVVAALGRAGWRVTALARRPDAISGLPGLDGPPPAARVACDLASDAAIGTIRREASDVDAVVHLAAFVPEDTGRPDADDALRTLAVNVRGTIRLLRALREVRGLGAVVHASSFEVYGAPERTPIDERHPTEPLGWYGASKLAAEQYLRLFGASRGIPCASLRFPAVYGPGDRIRRALGNFIRAAAAGGDLFIEGDGADRRDLVYAADAAAAILAALERRASGAFNAGSGTGWSILEMAEAVLRAAGGAGRIVRRERAKPRLDYALDSGKARRELGWEPATSLDAGIRAQLDWVRSGD